MLVIKVLGPDCKRRDKIVHRIRKALDEADIVYDIKVITDTFEIMSHGRLNTPAVMVNGKVVSMKRVPKTREILEWATTAKVPN